MKTRMILIAAALLLFVGASFAQQGFSAALTTEYQLRASTPSGCDNGAPLPDGTLIFIHWDQNNNGVYDDVIDPLTPVCPAPPDCPSGTVNYNTFAINSASQGMEPGTFYTEDYFTSYGVFSPARFFLVIRCAEGTVHYVSNAINLSAGPQEVIATWNCFPCQTVQPCNPTQSVTMVKTVGSNDPSERESACLTLCPGSETTITICRPAGQGGFDPLKPPVAIVRPGCDYPLDGCVEPGCTPAQFIYNPTGWVIDPAGCWTNIVYGVTEGCVCFTFDHFLAVGFNNNFQAVASDGSVNLSWGTSSEVGMARYDIIRNSDKVGEMSAANAAHTYNFVDESAVNGTSYTYTLRAVNMHGSVNDLATVEGVTPSFGAAVITEYALHQNFPNPFNPTTEITFDVVEKNIVSLKVFNSAGQVVATVANGEFEAGRHIVSFSAANLPSGLYFYSVKIGNEFSATKKMLLVK